MKGWQRLKSVCQFVLLLPEQQLKVKIFQKFKPEATRLV